MKLSKKALILIGFAVPVVLFLELATLAYVLDFSLPVRAGTPPRVGQRGMTAEDYYNQGLEHKALGWSSQAKESMKAAIELDPGSEIGINAKRFLQTRLPRYTVSHEAEQLNIRGFNLWQGGSLTEAEQVFLSTIAQYPNFEWPKGNLAALYIEQGRLDEAKGVLDSALKINPQYLNGWLHYADFYEKKNDTKNRIKCLEKAAELDPDNSALGLLIFKLTIAAMIDK